MSIGVLDGVKVLDLSEDIAGSFCARILADYGADVLKLEPPGGAALLRALSHRDRADLAGVDAAKPEGSLFIAHEGMGSIE